MRIGLIAGGQATDLHLRAMAHAGGFAVVAVAHPVAAARHDLARRLNCPAFDSAATLLDAAGLDGVVVASEPAERPAGALAALARRLPVAVQAPAGATGAEAARLVERADGALVAALHAAPHLPHYRLAQLAVAGGRAGRPAFIRSTYWGDPVGGLDATGGSYPALQETAEHLAAVNWLMGDAPERIYATAQSLASAALGGTDYLVVTVTYPRGQTAIVEFGGAHAGGASYSAILVLGGKGAIAYDSAMSHASLYGDAGARRVDAPAAHEPLAAAYAAFARAVGGDRTALPVDAGHAATAVRAAAAALASAASGRAAVLNGTGHVLT